MYSDRIFDRCLLAILTIISHNDDDLEEQIFYAEYDVMISGWRSVMEIDKEH